MQRITEIKSFCKVPFKKKGEVNEAYKKVKSENKPEEELTEEATITDENYNEPNDEKEATPDNTTETEDNTENKSE